MLLDPSHGYPYHQNFCFFLLGCAGVDNKILHLKLHHHSWLMLSNQLSDHIPLSNSQLHIYPANAKKMMFLSNSQLHIYPANAKKKMFLVNKLTKNINFFWH